MTLQLTRNFPCKIMDQTQGPLVSDRLAALAGAIQLAVHLPGPAARPSLRSRILPQRRHHLRDDPPGKVEARAQLARRTALVELDG